MMMKFLLFEVIASHVPTTSLQDTINFTIKGDQMNKERILGIINNLLLEMQEAKLLDNEGVNKVSRALIDNIKNT